MDPKDNDKTQNRIQLMYEIRVCNRVISATCLKTEDYVISKVTGY